MRLDGRSLAAVTAIDRISGWSAANKAGAVVRPGNRPTTAGDVDAAFGLASVTKLLSAYAVLVATEEEVVALDEPAGPPGSTVAHLLAHASGLGPDAGSGVIAPPGTRRIYSNAGFEVLADHLVAAAGLPFDTYLTEAVLEPLGMASTRLTGSRRTAPPRPSPISPASRPSCSHPSHLPATLTVATTPVPHAGGVRPGFGRQDPNPWGLGCRAPRPKSPHWTGAGTARPPSGLRGACGTFSVDPVGPAACIVLTDQPFGARAEHYWPTLSDAVLLEQPDPPKGALIPNGP